MTLTAAYGNGYTYGTWSGDYLSCSGTTDATPCTIVVSALTPMTGTETASFISTAPPATYKVTGDSGPADGGTVTATGAAPAVCSGDSCTAGTGDMVTLTATADSPGYTDGLWTGDTCSGTDATPCEVTVGTKDDIETANFTATARYTVASATAGTGGSVTVSSTEADKTCTTGANNSCTVYDGETVTLTATPATAYYQFSGWSGGSCGGANPCDVTATKGETDTATFGLAGVLNPAAAVFVSPSGNDSNPGTQGAPVATPNRALAIAAGSHGADTQIWIAAGSYAGPMTLTAADDNLAIYGNFNATTWTESPTPSATTVTGTPEGLIATDATGVSIGEVNFTGDAPGAPSSSAYGVVALGGSNITLSGAVVTAGSATNGAAGSAGGAGQNGGAGGLGGAGETPAQVTATCLGGGACTAVDGAAGAAGLGVNGNNYYVRDTVADQQNPLLDAAVLSIPLPGPGQSAGDGGLGGWGNTASGYTLQGCIGKAPNQVCGPEKKLDGKTEAFGYYYGGWGSKPYDAPTTYEGSGGAPGYANTKGDGTPGKPGSEGGNGATGAVGTSGSNNPPAEPTWTPGNGGSGDVYKRQQHQRDSKAEAQHHRDQQPEEHVAAVCEQPGA